MSNKYMTSYYNKITNICDFPIDCKQGLYLSLLRCLGETTSYTGARWPWIFFYKPRIDSFDIEANKLIDIVNLLTVNSIKKLFNVDLKYYFFNDYADVMKCIRHNILNDTPVIVNTDQYYIPYHNEHIYLHKHGLHATLLMGYDDDKDEGFCFSVTPEHKGIIAYKDLNESINNSSILWCAVMKKSTEYCVEKNDDIIFEDFQTNLREVAIEYNNSSIRLLEPNMQIYTKDILSVFSECSDSDDNSTYMNFKNLCDGRWGWEINTNVNLLVKYMLTHYVSCKYGNISSVLQTIEEYKIKWDIAYRKMFKMLRRKPKDIKKEIDLVTNDFNILVEFEKSILNQLII